ncbi:RNA polymerase-associated protein [Escherichia coli]|uniref:RNA polymerase-associated protein n=1 Tax=Escherichia coli TaxID=562 RepID=A0A376TL83_ECOLX|nr:RNA polymerase-associated protein [Escherichia coli]
MKPLTASLTRLTVTPGSKLVNAVQQDVHAILQLGEAQIEKSARALIDAARNEADEKLSAELSRLEALRAVNPNIRDDETDRH